jgi:hypothetical protein
VIFTWALPWCGVAVLLSSDVSRRHCEQPGTTLNRFAGVCMTFFGLQIAANLGQEFAGKAAD